MNARIAAARLVLRIAPGERADWAAAMAAEILHLDDRATLFALGCLRAAFGMRIEIMGRDAMMMIGKMFERPRATALLAGVTSCLLGLVYLVVAGAPVTMLAANAGALVLGLAAFAAARALPAATVAFVLASAAALLATAVAGLSVDGAARWVRVAGLSVQPSLILMPAALLLHLLRRSRATDISMALIALAMALQPDRGMAGVILAALIAGGRRSGALPIGAAAVAFSVTLVRADDLPAVAFVDGVLFSAPRAGWMQGTAVLGGTLVALLPLLVAMRDATPATRAFGVCWLGIVAAAALGNYPTPMVGYGGSAILGYLLAAGWLPSRVARHVGKGDVADEAVPQDRLFRLA